MSGPLPFTLEGPGGRAIHGLVDLPPDGGPGSGTTGAVVVSHGFKGFMEWGFFPYLATLLSARGLVVVRFDMTGSGMRPGDELVTDLAAFRSATLSRDVEDSLAVLAATREGRLAPGWMAADRVDPERIGLLGHSRGGGTSLVVAASQAGLEGVRALVTWNAVGRFERFSEAEVTLWREQGELVVVNSRTGQELPVGIEVLDDLVAHREELDLAAAAARRTAPWLQLHGSEDETVPADEGAELAAAAARPHEHQLIDGGNHTFGAQHPFVGPTPHLIQALNATQTWFLRHLGRHEGR